MRCSIALVLAILLSAPAAARAQATPAKKRHAPAWIAIGAASGFGVGLWAGLTSFDQSIDSERKIWTTALVSAAGGGVLAYLLTRRRTDRTGAARIGGDRCVGCDRCAGSERCHRCERCHWCEKCHWCERRHSAHLTHPSHQSHPSHPFCYSALSPTIGETRDALAAGR